MKILMVFPLLCSFFAFSTPIFLQSHDFKVIQDTANINETILETENQMVVNAIAIYLLEQKKLSLSIEELRIVALALPFEIIYRKSEVLIVDNDKLAVDLTMEVKINQLQVLLLEDAVSKNLGKDKLLVLREAGKDYLEDLILNGWSHPSAVVRMKSRLTRMLLEDLNIHYSINIEIDA